MIYINKSLNVTYSLISNLQGLSYTGDFRMTVGEDKNKVSNIVRPQLNRFKELYSGPLAEVSNNFHRDSRGQYKQDISPPIREEYFIRQTFLFIYMYNLECFTKKNLLGYQIISKGQ